MGKVAGWLGRRWVPMLLATGMLTGMVGGTPAHAAGFAATFAGDLSGPARGATSVHLNGDLTFTGKTATTLYLELFNQITNARVANANYLISDSASAGTRFVDLTWSLPTLDGDPAACSPCQLRATAGAEMAVLATWWIPGLTATSYFTASDLTQALPGTTATLTGHRRQTWTDGVTTESLATGMGYAHLQQRLVGTTTWTGVDGYCNYSPGCPTRVVLTQDADYRFINDSKPYASVAVDVVQPTDTRRFGELSLSATAGAATQSTTLTAPLDILYEDGQWRPAPVGTKFSVQLQRPGSPWESLSEATTETAGTAVARILFAATGSVRLVSNDAATAPAAVTRTGLGATGTSGAPAPVEHVRLTYYFTSLYLKLTWDDAAGANGYLVRISKRNSTTRYGKWYHVVSPQYTRTLRKGTYRLQIVTTGTTRNSHVTMFKLKLRRPAR